MLATPFRSAKELAVSPHELRAAGVVISLGAALALSPCGWRADFQMLAGRNTG